MSIASPFPAPADLDDAAEAWGANCGPASLAALLGRSLALTRPLVASSGFESRGYMNPTHMKAALSVAEEVLGFRPARGDAERWPVTGLAFIQFGGPWRNVYEAYRHTHWIAVREDWVYDCNADEWSPRWWWETKVAPVLASHTPGCDGTWSVRSGYEVRLR